MKTTFGIIEIGLKACRSRLTLDSTSFLNDKLVGRRFDEHIGKNVHVCMDSCRITIAKGIRINLYVLTENDHYKYSIELMESDKYIQSRHHRHHFNFKNNQGHGWLL